MDATDAAILNLSARVVYRAPEYVAIEAVCAFLCWGAGVDPAIEQALAELTYSLHRLR